MRRLPAAVCALALGLSGCSMWTKQHQPTANDNATRVPVTVRPVTTAPVATATPSARTASPSAGTPSNRSAAPATATPSPAAGEVPPMTSLGVGAVVYGKPATASPTAQWLESCKAWELRSTGGTVLGHALTTDTTTAGTIFAVRTDNPAVVGPGGLHVGSSTADVASAMPDGRRADSPDGTWVSRPDPATKSQFVVLLSRAGKVAAMAVLPADKTVEGYPAKPLC